MCARHIQSFNAKFTHFESMVGGLWGVGRRGRAFEFVFIEKKSAFFKTSLDCVLLSPAYLHPSAKTESGHS